MEISREGNLKRKAEKQEVEDESEEKPQSRRVILLSAPPAPFGQSAELFIPPSQEPSLGSQVGSIRSRRPPRQPQQQKDFGIRKADWEPQFRKQFEWYLKAERVFRRQLWEEWTTRERRRAYLYCCNPALKEEMTRWKRLEAEASQGTAVWVHDLTRDGDVESNPGPPDQPTESRGGLQGSDNAMKGERVSCGLHPAESHAKRLYHKVTHLPTDSRGCASPRAFLSLSLAPRVS